MSRPPAAPRIYFSLRSPFSWISLDTLQRVRPEVFGTSELLPYWDPAPDTLRALRDLGGEYHYTQMSRAKHLYILQDTKRITRRLGLKMAWPVDRSPRWEVPHLAWLAAKPADRPRIYRAFMAARWECGEDICDEGLVRDLLAGAGVDASLAGAHRDQDTVARGAEVMMRAYRDDVFGLPYFRCGNHRYWGLDRLGWFLACYDGWRRTGRFVSPEEPSGIDRLAALEEPGQAPGVDAIPGVEWAYDVDTPGGCG